MFKTTKPARDAFAFSLGGLTVIGSYIAAPAIADDLINQARDERLSQTRDRGNRTRDQRDPGCCPEPA